MNYEQSLPTNLHTTIQNIFFVTTIYTKTLQQFVDLMNEKTPLIPQKLHNKGSLIKIGASKPINVKLFHNLQEYLQDAHSY
jgi:hypothetical protein